MSTDDTSGQGSTWNSENDEEATHVAASVAGATPAGASAARSAVYDDAGDHTQVIGQDATQMAPRPDGSGQDRQRGWGQTSPSPQAYPSAPAAGYAPQGGPGQYGSGYPNSAGAYGAGPQYTNSGAAQGSAPGGQGYPSAPQGGYASQPYAPQGQQSGCPSAPAGQQGGYGSAPQGGYPSSPQGGAGYTSAPYGGQPSASVSNEQHYTSAPYGQASTPQTTSATSSNADAASPVAKFGPFVPALLG